MANIFLLKQEHLTLLKRAYVSWNDCENGAPTINPKRPYGNSDVAHAVAEALGKPSARCPHCNEYLGPVTEEKFLKIHEETQIALQIVLNNIGEEVLLGRYILESYGNVWKRIE